MLRSVVCPSLAPTGVRERKCDGRIKRLFIHRRVKAVGFCRCRRLFVNIRFHVDISYPLCKDVKTIFANTLPCTTKIFYFFLIYSRL